MTFDAGRSGAVVRQVRATGRTALVGYLPVGFPDITTTRRAAASPAEHVDLLVLGHPTDDASRDGHAVSSALMRACGRGVGADHLVQLVEEVAAGSAPVLVEAYWHEIVRMGPSAYCRELAQAGCVGVLTPDLQPEHGAKWVEATDRFELDRILSTRTGMSDEKLAMLAGKARGMVYVPGICSDEVGQDVADVADRLRAQVPDVVMVSDIVGGTREDARRTAAHVDAIVAGASLVEVLPGGSQGDMAPLQSRVEELAAGLDR